MRTRFSAICVAAVALACGLLLWRAYEERQRLREETRALKAELSIVQAQAVNAPAGVATSAEPSSNVSSELLRLRAEVSRLRAQPNELIQLQRENMELRRAVTSARATASNDAAAPSQTAGTTYFPKEQWAFAGFATPEAAFQSALWAISQGNRDALVSALSPEELSKLDREMDGLGTPEEFAVKGPRQMEKVKGFHILNREQVADDEVVLQVYAEGEDQVIRMKMKRSGDEWKMAGKARKPRSEQ